jgi:hypothetical protein
MKLNEFEWSSKMSKTIKSLAVVALLATPTFAAAQGFPVPSIAASISASFGSTPDAAAAAEVNAGNPLAGVTAPTSVSVAGAMGLVAVATASATADASSATSASSVDSMLTPALSVTLSATGYESTVAFTPVIDAEALAAAICAEGFTASQGTSTGTVYDRSVTVDGSTPGTDTYTGDLDDDEVTISNGAISVDCAPV